MRVWAGFCSFPALTRARPTPTRLAMLAQMRMASAATLELSSMTAIALVCAGSLPRVLTSTHATNTAPVTSQPTRSAICQGVSRMATAKAARPLARQAASRVWALTCAYREPHRCMPPSRGGIARHLRRALTRARCRARTGREDRSRRHRSRGLPPQSAIPPTNISARRSLKDATNLPAAPTEVPFLPSACP